MGHVVDRWTVPDPDRPGRRMKGPRHGRGKRWLARWPAPDGRQHTKAFASKDEAGAHLAEVEVAVRGGTYVRRIPTTFKAYADRWLEHQLHHRPSTAAAARSKLEGHAYPAIGEKALAAVTRGDVQDLVTGATSLGPAARRVLYVYVRAVFAAAVDDQLVARSPCVRIRLPRVEQRPVTPLTVAQVKAIAAAMTPHLRGAGWLAAGTGLRPGELRGLSADRLRGDVVSVDRQLAMPGTMATRVVWAPLKTEASTRAVRLAPATGKALADHLEHFPTGPARLLFVSGARTPLRRSHLQWAWEKATEGMGLEAQLGERHGWHDLRRHHASLLIAAGMSPPRAVADRLGHANPAETLATYAHLWASDEDQIVEAVEHAYGDRGVAT